MRINLIYDYYYYIIAILKTLENQDKGGSSSGLKFADYYTWKNLFLNGGRRILINEIITLMMFVITTWIPFLNVIPILIGLTLIYLNSNF